MNRLLFLLAVAIGLTLTAVDLRHRNRVQFAHLQKLQTERDSLDIEWGQLLLEQAAWSEHRRVEGMARAQLGMTLPRSEQVTVVDARVR